MAMDTASDRWERLSPEFDQGVGERASIGLLALATDRIGTLDTEAFIAAPGVAMFSTRIQSSPVATPESLAKLGEQLEQEPGSWFPARGSTSSASAARRARWRSGLRRCAQLSGGHGRESL